ncbi:hypothetical protein [Phycicoccus avicenniae]|uniref:hypothetical protein n=1 Tax=Phycicoccus avicenniae TaxID=2828860 RepID=UPI003D2E31EF
MSATPWDCPDCGDTHPKGCHAHTNLKDDDGRITGRRACKAPAVTGLTVCYRHGGATAKASAKAATARTEQAAAREVARLGVKLDVHPATALIDLVQWTAGEVAYWRDVVTVLAEGGHEALTWGVTKTEQGTDRDQVTDITTEQAGQHIAYTMLEKASDRLASYAAAALRAGVDERRVQLAERQGALVADVIKGVLDALHLTPEQLELVPTVVPAQLRLLTATKEIG